MVGVVLLCWIHLVRKTGVAVEALALEEVATENLPSGLSSRRSSRPQSLVRYFDFRLWQHITVVYDRLVLLGALLLMRE